MAQLDLKSFETLVLLWKKKLLKAERREEDRESESENEKECKEGSDYIVQEWSYKESLVKDKIQQSQAEHRDSYKIPLPTSHSIVKRGGSQENGKHL